jgi:hypothetical protein
MTKGKYVAHKGDFDLTDWTLDTFEDMAEEHWKPLLLKALAELLEIAVKEKVHAYLPSDWNFGDPPEDGRGGPAVADPLIIYVGLPIAQEEGEQGAFWSFDFRELVRDSIAGSESPDDGHIDGEQRKQFEDLLVELGALMEEVRAALARPKLPPIKKKRTFKT